MFSCIWTEKSCCYIKIYGTTFCWATLCKQAWAKIFIDCPTIGKPAYEMLDSDPDWVPSLHLGHDGDDECEEKSWNKRRRLSSDEKPVEGGSQRLVLNIF